MKKLLIICILTGCTFHIINGQSLVNQTTKIYHDVPFIPQPTGTSCWSSSIAMILFWKQNVKLHPESLKGAWASVSIINNSFPWQNYFGDGLPSNNTHPFKVWNFERVNPQSVSIDGWKDLLNYSPVWLAYDPSFPIGVDYPTKEQIKRSGGHAIVIVGMVTDGTHEGTTIIYHDPDKGTGSYPNEGRRDQVITLKDLENRLESRVLNRVSQGMDIGKLNFIAYPKLD